MEGVKGSSQLHLVRVQVVLPHIRGTIEDLHVGEVAFSMPLAKHLPPTLVDDQTALHLKQIISHFFQVPQIFVMGGRAGFMTFF